MWLNIAPDTVTLKIIGFAIRWLVTTALSHTPSLVVEIAALYATETKASLLTHVIRASNVAFYRKQLETKVVKLNGQVASQQTIAVSSVIEYNWIHDWDNSWSSTSTAVHACSFIIAITIPYLYALERCDGSNIPRASLCATNVVKRDLFHGVQAGIEDHSDGSKCEPVTLLCKGQTVDVVLEYRHVLDLRVTLLQSSNE